MRFTLFHTPKPKKFTYKPRYYDEEKDRLEQKKAEMGYDSKLSHRESLRLQMSNKWRRGSASGASNTSQLTKFVYYTFYGFVIIGSVYVIFFTEFVEKLVALFGVGR